MIRQNPRWAAVAASVIALTGGVASTALAGTDSAPVHHVLLISVDGLHASDVTRCVAAGLCPNIATLMARGTSYSNVSASEPSDSSPGLMALATGGTPKLTGVYYDDSYDRTMFTPAAQTPTSTQDCSGSPGAETMYAENIDTNAPSTANGGVGTRTIMNESIDPTQLPYQLVGGKCVQVMPNDFLRANSIFSVAHQTGLSTAWADKHPAADQQVSGHGTPNGMPAIFGMNFQAVSVGQKLVDPQLSCVRSNNAPGCDPKYFPGGYEPTTLQFTPQLSGAISFVDGALGKMVAELKAQNQLSSTEIIVTAKHGQSPIDPSKLAKIGHAETKVVTNAGVAIAQTTDDDISLMWLKDQSQETTAVNALMADKAGANTARVQYVLSGQPLADRFNSPLVDPRTPDLIVQPIPGTIYSGSGAKVAEHGGFATDDTHVALIVVNGALLTGNGGGNVVDDRVTTSQVAPTVLAALGLNPGKLDAARIEHTPVLPDFNS